MTNKLSPIHSAAVTVTRPREELNQMVILMAVFRGDNVSVNFSQNFERLLDAFVHVQHHEAEGRSSRAGGTDGVSQPFNFSHPVMFLFYFLLSQRYQGTIITS